VVNRYRLDAFTLKCFDLLAPLGTTGCMALAVFNSRGIPAGCEGDVPALLTMLLARRVMGVEAFMANPSHIDRVNNRIIFAHCTLPLAMAERNILRSHFESGIGVALQGVLPLGDVTVVKWWGPEMEHYFISRGRLVENLDNPSMCRTQVCLALDESVDYFLTNPLGNHHIILLGDHSEAFRRFFTSNRRLRE
ncbi:MAG: fucose isomerase, partial [Paramuribaculum sp.]|nr:fucose isomerase [Paramuribaculum sp.]